MLGAVLAVAAAGAPQAHAGTYDVVACDAAPGGANNSWVPYIGNPQAATAYTQCPTGGSGTRGIIARNVVVANTSAGGNVVGRMQFTAAPGTSIVSITASYDFYRSDAQWEAALSTGSVALRGCTIGGPNVCGIAIPNETIPVPGGTQVLYIDAYCASNSCPLSGPDPAHSYLSAWARLTSASVRLQDDSAPAVSASGSLWSSAWLGGAQTLVVGASDNAGIRQTRVLADGNLLTANPHGCDASLVIPCPNTGDTYNINTATLADGPHALRVEAYDSANNGNALGQTVLIDNTPPGPPINAAVAGGEGWRAQNSFDVSWTNPTTANAPLAGAQWQVCPASGAQTCTSGSKDGSAVTSLAGLTVPRDGDWVLKLWLRDAAGNQTINNAANPMRLRVDSVAPTAVFSPLDASDPTRVVIQASDATSGIGSGAVDFRPVGAESWTSVPARVESGRVVANLPDETMADGPYELRGHVADRAGNERTVTTTADGKPVLVTLPLRSPTHLIGGRAQSRKRHGKRVRYLASRVRLNYGRRTRIQGRLADKDNRSLSGTPVVVSELLDVPNASWQPVRTLRTDRNGRFSFRTAKRGASRTVRVRYEGTPTVRPSQADVHLVVAASSTFRVSRRRVRVGHGVRFSGTLRGGHVVPGQSVLLQVHLRIGRHWEWQTFSNTKANAKGAWTKVYNFTGSYAGRSYPFRARIPSQAGYPFATGHSRSRAVRVLQ